MDGGTSGKYSRYYRCGYSAGVAGGTGSLDAAIGIHRRAAYTRGDCEARGMFHIFGGIEFVPPAISVRTLRRQELTHVRGLGERGPV